jgi:hypothetical protein
MIELYKLINGLEDFDCEKLLSFNDNPTRGHIYRLIKPRCVKSVRLNAFPARAIDN